MHRGRQGLPQRPELSGLGQGPGWQARGQGHSREQLAPEAQPVVMQWGWQSRGLGVGVGMSPENPDCPWQGKQASTQASA